MFSVQPQIVAFLVENGVNPITAASAFGVSGISATVGFAGVWCDRRQIRRAHFRNAVLQP